MREIISAWRIASRLYGGSVQQLMSGEGARKHGGRWNSAGREMVYLSESLSLATLELLVNMRSQMLLRGMVRLNVRFSADLAVDIPIEMLPANWYAPDYVLPTQAIGNAWLESRESVLLRVPSAVIHSEFNYLLNPNHPDVNAIEFGAIENHIADARLFR